jgi:hypothetical protein
MWINFINELSNIKLNIDFFTFKNICIGATVHSVIPRNNITFKTYENLLENELAPLMKQSLAAHPHQELIWLKPSLTIERHATSDNSLHQDKMKRYTDILPRIFKYSSLITTSPIIQLMMYIHNTFIVLLNCIIESTGVRELCFGTRSTSSPKNTSELVR